LGLTNLEREKGYPAADHPKRKEPAIKRTGSARQKTARWAKKNATTVLIRYQMFVTAMFRVKSLDSVLVIGKKIF
jgi:hypothetical protein